jgi:DNA-binding response OmpR family regulator
VPKLVSRGGRYDGTNEALAPLVGVLNADATMTDLVELVLEEEGYRSVALVRDKMKGGDIDAFFGQHDARVVVYDLGMPYEKNWRLFSRILAAPFAAGRRFILTTTNVGALHDLAGSLPMLQIIEKPFDLHPFIDAVRRAFCGLEPPSGSKPAF